MSAVVKLIENTKVLDSDSEFARELRGDREQNESEGGVNKGLLKIMNNSLEHQCLEEAIFLLGAVARTDAPEDTIRGTKYKLKALPNVTFLAHQIWAIWFIVRRWVFDVDLPGVILADEMGLGKTFTVMAAALYAKMLTHDLLSDPSRQLPVLFNQSLQQWQHEVSQGFPSLTDAQKQWYPCRHRQPLPRRLTQLAHKPEGAQDDPPPWNPVLCVVLASVHDTFVCAINTIIANMQFKVRDLSSEGGSEFSHTRLNFSRDHPEREWDIHVITYNSLTERAQRNLDGTPGTF